MCTVYRTTVTVVASGAFKIVVVGREPHIINKNAPQVEND